MTSTSMGVFSMLQRSFGDPRTAEIFSERCTVAAWLRVEAELARAEARLGMIDTAAADAIVAACDPDRIDLPALWEGMSNVGYPILPLVRQVTDHLGAEASGSMHFGATTQDIMDSGFALQIAEFIDHLDSLLVRLGDALAAGCDEHACTVMAGRTHGQQAVPITFGAKLGGFLAQVQRQQADLHAIRPSVCVLSLHGAAGTSAGFGRDAGALRHEMAARLGLTDSHRPIHATRDSIAAFGAACGRLAAVCIRLAREVIDLSRTEVAELFEPSGHHRGASSTMPQKVNPILSESALGFGVTAATLSSALLRAIEVGHERSAGEWQIEWAVTPQLCAATAGAVRAMVHVAEGWEVDAERMATNLAAEQGRTLAEAYMFELAPELGRETAHDVVYEAAAMSRLEGISMHVAMLRVTDNNGLRELTATDYLGDSESMASTAAVTWRARAGTNRFDEVAL